MPTPVQAFRKMSLGQLTFFPVYLTAFYMYMGTLEGKTPSQSFKRFLEVIGPTYATGSIFWPIANMFNFR